MRSLLIVFALIFSIPAQARIGETLEQCVARYGQPVETNALAVIFVKSEISIISSFNEQGVCDLIMFKKEHGGDWNDDDLVTIIEANLGKDLVRGRDGEDPLWTSADGSMASFNFNRAMLVIVTEAGVARRKKYEAESRSVKGF